MTNNTTEKALIARGFDSATATRLRQAGQTLEKLKLADDQALTALGLNADQIMAIRNGPRPAIPQEDLAKVLFANRWVCCVCREPDRPIIVHHIKEWSSSRDHSPENLAVLCTIHHGEAHTHRQLEQNLTSARISALKTQWEQQVQRDDAHAIQQGSQLQHDNWFYFNHLRLFELAQELGVVPESVPGYQQALSDGACDQAGAVMKKMSADSFMYADSGGMQLYRYVTGLFRAVMQDAVVRNVSDYLDRGLLGNMVVPGDLVFVQGIHTFSPQRPAPAGTQLVKGSRTANRVVVNFVFDLAEATSASAWSLWLRGRQSVGSLVQVKQLQRVDGKLHLTGTVLAIRSAVSSLKERMYEQRLYEAGIPQRREAAAEEDEFSGFDDESLEGFS